MMSKNSFLVSMKENNKRRIMALDYIRIILVLLLSGIYGNGDEPVAGI